MSDGTDELPTGLNLDAAWEYSTNAEGDTIWWGNLEEARDAADGGPLWRRLVLRGQWVKMEADA